MSQGSQFERYHQLAAMKTSSFTKSSLVKCPWHCSATTIGVARCTLVATVAGINPNTHWFGTWILGLAFWPSCFHPISVLWSVKTFRANWFMCKLPSTAWIYLTASAVSLSHRSKIKKRGFKWLRNPWYCPAAPSRIARCSLVATVAGINPYTDCFGAIIPGQAFWPSCFNPILVLWSVEALLANWSRGKIPCTACVYLTSSAISVSWGNEFESHFWNWVCWPWHCCASTIGVARRSLVATVTGINPNTHWFGTWIFGQTFCPSCFHPISVLWRMKVFSANWWGSKFPCTAWIYLTASAVSLPHIVETKIRCFKCLRNPWHCSTIASRTARCSLVAPVTGINPNTHWFGTRIFGQTFCPGSFNPNPVFRSMEVLSANRWRCKFPSTAGIDLTASAVSSSWWNELKNGFRKVFGSPWFGSWTTIGIAKGSVVATVAGINPNTHESCTCILRHAIQPSCFHPRLVFFWVKCLCTHWWRSKLPSMASIYLTTCAVSFSLGIEIEIIRLAFVAWETLLSIVFGLQDALEVSGPIHLVVSTTCRCTDLLLRKFLCKK